VLPLPRNLQKEKVMSQLRAVVLVLIAAHLCCADLNAAELPLGALRHDGPPTPEQISLYLPVTDRLDSSATATVRYQSSSSGQSLAAHPLHRIRPEDAAGSPPAEAFAGVITGLSPGTSYSVEVAVKLGETSAVRTLTATTRSLPKEVDKTTKRITAGTTSKQINAVLKAANPGDVIQFDSGTYVVDGLQIQRSGTEVQPVYIRGESRRGVRLKDTSGTILQVLAVSDVILEDLTLEGSNTDSRTDAASRGISFWNGGLPQERVTVRRVTFEGVDMGVVAWGDTKQLLVYDNTLTGNNKWEARFLHSNLTWNDDGIRVPGMGSAVFNNTLNGFGDALAMSAGAANTGIHFYRNDIRMTGDDAFEGDYGVRNITFYDNRIHNSMTHVSFDPLYGGPAFVFRNIAINVGRAPYKLNNKNTGFFLYNNTVVRTKGFSSGKDWGWVQFANGPLVAWAYRNNILLFYGGERLLAIESRGQDQIDFDHNAWYPDASVWWTRSGGSFKSIGEARSKLPATTPVFGASTHRHEADVITQPNPFTVELHLGTDHLTQITVPYAPRLAEGTAPRNAGVVIPGVTDGFSGKAPDMGALITGREACVWGDRTLECTVQCR
jgi:hypothetical protein